MRQLTYDDVLIEPQYSDILSRQDVDITTRLSDDLVFKLPICSANMKDITGSKMATRLLSFGSFVLVTIFIR